MTAINLTVDDEKGTHRLAEDIAMILAPGDVIALKGDLGAGKSTFARALLRALADDEALEVPSPTFTLAQIYEFAALTVGHFDLYRLADPSELAEIGLFDAIASGAVLVEWPERAGGALPADALALTIEEADTVDGRRFTLSGGPAWMARVQRTLAIRALLGPRARRRRMTGDASSRRYERVGRGAERLVLMDWPRRGPQPILDAGLTYPELVHVQDDALAFLGVAAILRGAGFRVPAIAAVDRAAGLIAMEDLGTTGIVEHGRAVPERMIAAAEVVAEKDAARLSGTVDVEGFGRWALPTFDARAMLTELSLLPDWYLPMLTGSKVDPKTRRAFLDAWAPLVAEIASLPSGVLLRDVIAANLVWMDGAEGRRRVAFLDFQDAMIGPRAYDIMALTTDVRLDIPPDLATAMLDAYAARVAAAEGDFDRMGFDRAFALASAQRNSKILGGFARLAIRDGKRAYLDHLPLVRRRVTAAVAHPVLRPLRLWYERHGILE